jgi:Carboxypeptidase regulatory-like domain
MTYRMYRVFLLLVLFSSFTVGAFAQNANSSINGTVKDTHGAIVPGATVTLTNIGTNQVLTKTTGGEGYYVFTNLSPANYNLAVTAPGFAKWVGVLTLRVSQSATVDATLNAASVSTQVTVRDVTPIIDRVNPTISDVKNATAIETIPVANRSILNVLAFSPGVVAGGYGGSGGGYTRMNGVPGGSVDYHVDGQTMTTRWTNELQQDAQSTMTFQEVKVITANGDAQYNRPGVVELVTKSGTNQFHGQIFELNQNNHLQAHAFNTGKVIPYLQHNEYGGQLGGPVWLPKIYNGRNKTFFFVDFEWIKDKRNALEQYSVPTKEQRQGVLTGLLVGNTASPLTIYNPFTTTNGAPYARTPFVDNVIPTTLLNPVTQKVFGITPVSGLVPLALPNVNVSNTDLANYTPNYIPPSSKATNDLKTYTAKVDQLFGPNRLAARYTYSHSENISPKYYAPTQPDGGVVGGHNGSLTFTQVITQRAINVIHVGETYNHAFRGPINIPGVAQALGLPPYQNLPVWPQFYFDGNDNYWTGIDRDNPQDYPNSTIVGSDQFTYNRGNHQMLFGFDVANTRINTYEVGQPGSNYNFSGNFSAIQDPTAPDGNAVANTGSGLADFLLGQVDYLSTNVYPHYHTQQTEFDGYAQDNWRVNQRLTVNLGLRYEFWTAFKDAKGLYSTLDPDISGGMTVYAGTGAPAQTPPAVVDSYVAAGLPLESSDKAGYPSSLLNMPKNNFEPRLGFAYELNNKTVLRGGWGIYQWVIPLQQFEQATRKNPPFFYQASMVPGEINGTNTNTNAAELEFPNAQTQYGGPQPVDRFALGGPDMILDTSNVHITQGSGFNWAALSPNYKPSTVQEWNLTLSRELPAHIGFQLSYIGNYSYNLLDEDPINYTIPRLECTTAGATDIPNCEAGVAKARRAYPVYSTSGSGNFDLYYYDGHAHTNELQVQVQHTFGNGLLLQSYFTWGKFLTTSEDSLLGVGGLSPEPAALTPGYSLASPTTSGASRADRVSALLAPDSNLPAKTFQINGHYQLPFGKGQAFLGDAHGLLNALVSGYNISAFFLWHSGLYFSPHYTPLASNTYLAPGKTGVLPKGQRNAQHWFDASTYDESSGAPYAGQTYLVYSNPSDSAHTDYHNNIPRNYMTGPGFNNMDANIYKLTPIWRNLVFDFEAQIFNVYNHQNWNLPNYTNGSSAILNSIGTPRTVQLQAKFIF